MKYPFRVYRTVVGNHVFWAAEIPALSGCVAQGETMEEALKQLECNEHEWLETAKEFQLEIPDIPIEEMELYSGKFTVRMAAHVHKAATELSKKQGVSLNQYVNDAIVAQNAIMTTTAAIHPCVEHAIKQVQWMASSAVTESKAATPNTLISTFDKEDDEFRVRFKPIFAK